MKKANLPRILARAMAVVAAATISLVLVACASDSSSSSSSSNSSPSAGSSQSSSSTSSSSSSAQGSSSGAAQAVDPAKLYAAVSKGTSVLPDATARKVAKGKHVVVVANGLNQPSTLETVNGIKAACSAIGWSCSVNDAKSDPTQYAAQVKQAITLRPDGIILMGIDCPLIAQPLKQAKAAGIKIVGAQSYDCSEPSVGGSQEFNATPAYPNPLDPTKTMDYRTYAQLFGAAKAATVIHSVHGKANVIQLCDNEALILVYICQGQQAELAKAGATVATVPTKLANLGPPLASQVSSALLKDSAANAIISPHSGASLIIAPAVLKAGAHGKLFVMGSEGITAELDMVRRGLVNAVMGANTAWVGWAAVDTMNSVFGGLPVYNDGVGWLLITKSNVPPQIGTGLPASKFPDYVSAYKKAWGAG